MITFLIITLSYTLLSGFFLCLGFLLGRRSSCDCCRANRHSCPK